VKHRKTLVLESRRSHTLNNRWQTWAIVIIIHWFINPIWAGRIVEREELLVIDTDDV